MTRLDVALIVTAVIQLAIGFVLGVWFRQRRFDADERRRLEEYGRVLGAVRDFNEANPDFRARLTRIMQGRERGRPVGFAGGEDRR